jgi:hypothetical protein
MYALAKSRKAGRSALDVFVCRVARASPVSGSGTTLKNERAQSMSASVRRKRPGGSRADALDVLSRVYARFEEGHATADLIEATGLLNERRACDGSHDPSEMPIRRDCARSARNFRKRIQKSKPPSPSPLRARARGSRGDLGCILIKDSVLSWNVIQTP